MIDIQAWLCAYQKAINTTFGTRVQFIGLQGSYARGEATEKSDLDVVLILDKVTMADLNLYKKITAVLPHSERLCGFVSRKRELIHWCSHNYLHAMDTDALQALYKAAFFVLQAKHFCETGEYVNRRAKLADCLAVDDLAVLQQSGDTIEEQTAILLAWASQLIDGKEMVE